MSLLGPALIVLSVPLVMRWVPRNPIYGFRVPATCRKKSVWYDANALCGRHLIALGVALVLLQFILPAAIRSQTVRWAALIGLALIVIADWHTANRWDSERSE